MLLCKLEGFVSRQHLALHLPIVRVELVPAFQIPAFCLSGPVGLVHGASYGFLVDEDLIVDVAFFHDDIDALLAGEESAGRRMMNLRVVLGQFIVDNGQGLAFAAVDQMHIYFIR